MIEVGVGVEELPAKMIGIAPEISLHVVNFFLAVDADGAVDADDFVGTDTGIGGDVAVGIGNAHVGGFVVDVMVSAFDGGGNEFLGEDGVDGIGRWNRLR
jgi:hypothetical protein